MDARAVNEVNSAAGVVWPLSWTTRWDWPMHVVVENVVRTFGVTPALHGVSLDPPARQPATHQSATAVMRSLSALPPKADLRQREWHVRF